MGWKPQPRYHAQRGYWYCRIAGRQHYLGVDEPTAYRKFAALIGGDYVPSERPETVVEAVEAWLRLHGGKWETFVLDRYAEWCEGMMLHRIDADHLKKWARECRKRGLAPRTIKHYVNFPRRVLEWCHEHEWIDRVPTRPKLQKAANRPRDISPDVLKKAWSTLPETTKPILNFIIEVGCRPSEACGLRWQDIDLRKRVAVLGQHKTRGATGNARTIYLTAAAVAILKATPRRKGHVFLNRLAKPFTPVGLRSVLRRRGINSTYALRHTRAQQLLDSGVALEDVGGLLGHRDLSTTQIYAQVRQDRLRKVAASVKSALG